MCKPWVCLVHCLENMFKFEELPCFYYLYSALSLFYVTSDTNDSTLHDTVSSGDISNNNSFGCTKLVIEHAELHNIKNSPPKYTYVQQFCSVKFRAQKHKDLLRLQRQV